jgi:hypothetical protein
MTLFTIAKVWNQSRSPSVDEWMKKMWYIYTMEFYSAVKKNKKYVICWKWIELEIMISEINQSHKHNCHMFFLVFRS